MRLPRPAAPSFSDDAPTLPRLFLVAADSEPAIELDENDIEIVGDERRRFGHAPFAAAMMLLLVAVGLFFDPSARDAVTTQARVLAKDTAALLRSEDPKIADVAPIALATIDPQVVAWPRDSTSTIAWQPSPTNADWANRVQASPVSRAAPRQTPRAPSAFNAPRPARHEPKPLMTQPTSPRPAQGKPARSEDDVAALRDAKRALQAALR